MALQRLYISTEEYFALPGASNSGVKDAHKLMHARDEEPMPNQAYVFGSALDAVLTDPSTIDTSGLVREERQMLMAMIDNLNKDPDYKVLFKSREYTDVQAVFYDPEFPINFDGRSLTIPAKCKFDWWNNLLGSGGDLKSSQSRTQEQFEAAAKWFRYPQQAAWYMDITGSKRFTIFGVSKWNYKVFKVSYRRDDDNYKEGRAQYLECCADWYKLYGISA